MSNEWSDISGSSCMKVISHLEGIGIRLAGTKGEQKAADWIERQFSRIGLSDIRQQEFPCLTFGHSKCRVSVQIGGVWKEVKSEPAAHSPATPEGGVEAPMVFVEDVPSALEKCREMMGGKTVLIYASLLFHPEKFRRTMEALPKAMLVVDDRFHGDWTVAVGFPRYWVDFLTCPVINVTYQDAWEMVKSGATRVRVELDSFVKEATSQNVIGEIKGSSWPEEVVVISGHHDSVANNPGADDNCTGVAAVLELARAFVNRRPRRTLRFISYGTEEQLSEGARIYASSVKKINRIKMVLNVDAIGAWMGQTLIFCTGRQDLARFVESVDRQTGFPGHIKREVIPFSDHFPLNLRGVPSVWYYRQTYVAARHFHHSPLETIDVISPAILERTIRSQAVLLSRVLNEEALPFERELTASQKKELKKMALEWVGVEEL